MCHKAFEEKSLSTAGIPYLKVSGFSDAIQGIEELLKVTFRNNLPSTMCHGDIHVVLTSTAGEAIVEFENHEGNNCMVATVNKN